MAGTIHHPWNRGLPKNAEDKHCERSRQQTIDCLWKEQQGDPPSYLPRKGLALDANLFENNGKLLQGIPPLRNSDASAFVNLLKTCAKNKDLYRGSRAHDNILDKGLLEECSDALVIMYAKCGALAKAKKLLDMHKSRDVFVWTALITGYAHQGKGHNALDCFEQMLRVGITPSPHTFASILKACGSIKAIDKGEQIHDEIARQGLLEHNIKLGNALVDMYVKCGALTLAQSVLEELPSRNVITWNSLISGYAQHGRSEQALNCFEWMQCEGLSPNVVTFIGILKACGSIKAVNKGEEIHDQIAKQGLLQHDIVLGTALVDMYAKCGALAKAQRVLEEIPSRDVITWSALIAGYAQHGQGKEALDCFEQMQHEGISPNAMTFSCILKACSSRGDIDKGKQIHDQISRQGLFGKDVVLGTALVDMYAKCGDLAKAAQVLEELPSQNVTSWNALITGYAQQGQGKQALNCFERMQFEGLTPNSVTFLCVLNVCSHLGLVEYGYMYFVDMSTKYGVNPELEHYSCMVDLLGRAGHLDKAVGVIQEMPFSNHSAVLCTLLGACRKWGDVKVGRWAFEHAVQVDKSYALAYVLMADLYAAAGMKKDAEIIEAMRMANKAWRRPEQEHQYKAHF